MLTSLSTKIEYLRKTMIDIAMQKGMDSDESIMISKELDELLNVHRQFKNYQVSVSKVNLDKPNEYL